MKIFGAVDFRIVFPHTPLIVTNFVALFQYWEELSELGAF